MISAQNDKRCCVHDARSHRRNGACMAIVYAHGGQHICPCNGDAEAAPEPRERTSYAGGDDPGAAVPGRVEELEDVLRGILRELDPTTADESPVALVALLYSARVLLGAISEPVTTDKERGT